MRLLLPFVLIGAILAVGCPSSTTTGKGGTTKPTPSGKMDTGKPAPTPDTGMKPEEKKLEEKKPEEKKPEK